MTESEFLASDNPAAMLAFLSGTANTTAWLEAGKPTISDRKLRLFACACFRVGTRRNDQEALRVVETHERYADGEESEADLRATHDFVFRNSLWNVADPPLAWLERELDYVNCPPVVQAALLREVVGNPFRLVSRLKRTVGMDVVIDMAQHVYDTRDFAALPVLADALEDAGCTEQTLLRHLRGETPNFTDAPAPHVRGCWALDLQLGKE